MAEELQASSQNAPSPPDLSSLLSDPAMQARIAAVMSSMQSAPSTTQESTAPAPSAPDGLSRVLSDPALMEKLPQIMAMLAPALSASAPQKTDAVPASVLPRSPTADRDNLLLAIKPFLSSGRRDAVDTILRLEKLGELLKYQNGK
ncbi:MAG: hypothetical protein IJW16_02690 [Clostridia bacterium]|nr:hypothetical protein [Clostridia bacterium]